MSSHAVLKFINRNPGNISKKFVNKSLKTSTSNQIQAKVKLEVSSLFVAAKESYDTSKSILSYIKFYIISYISYHIISHHHIISYII